VKPKVGDSFWRAHVFEGRVNIEEWVVSSVRRARISRGVGRLKPVYQNKAYLIRKNKSTWVKRSSKRHDYGWSKSISRHDRTEILYEDDWMLKRITLGLVFSTKLKALLDLERYECARLKKGFDDFEYGDKVWTAAEQEWEQKKDLTAIRRAITRERNSQAISRKIKRERRESKREIDEQVIDRLRESTSDRSLPKFAWPGGYTLIYLDAEIEILCAECADIYVKEGGKLSAYGTYDEGPTIYCEECNAEIESSYGDPDQEEDQEN
jgi:hypothetical protein